MVRCGAGVSIRHKARSPSPPSPPRRLLPAACPRHPAAPAPHRLPEPPSIAAIRSLSHSVKLLTIFSGPLRTSDLGLCFAYSGFRRVHGDLETISTQRPHFNLNRTNSAKKAVRDQQRQHLCLIAVPSTEPGLQLGTAEQELLTSWQIVRGACSILLLSASPLDSLIIAVHVDESLDQGQRSAKRKVKKASRRTKQTRLKQGIRGSCARASQHRLKTCKITSKGMKANELLDHLKQQRGNSNEMKREEMDEVTKDTHEEEKETKKVKAKTTERRTVMNSDDPIHGSWKTNSKDENDLTFISINVNSLAHWSREGTRRSASNTFSKSTALTRQGYRKCV